MKPPIIIVVVILAALAVAGGAFWGGMSVGKAQAQDAQSSFLASRGFDPNAVNGTSGTGATGANGGFSGRTGGTGANGQAGRRGAFGTISAVTGNTITVTDNQGQAITVALADNTPVVKSVLGSKSDLTVGTHVIVQGTRSGNNVSATAVQITDGPAGVDGLFGGGAGRARATPTPSTK